MYHRHCERSKAIQTDKDQGLDCFVAYAPRNGDYPGLDFYFGSRYIPFTDRKSAMTAFKRPKPVHQMTVAQFEKAFPDEEACKAYLVARRWPNGVHCPRCGNTEVTELS